MKKNNVTIVLGGTGPSITVLETLKNKGFYTILVDYLENPPAKSFADEHIKISTLDKEGVLEVARKTNASLVVNLLIDWSMATAAYVAEKLNLPSLISYEASQLVTNKELMKKRMFENKIPTAKYCIINNFENIYSMNIIYPLIAKPIIGHGSVGVEKINCLNELECYLHNNVEDKKNCGIILEECYNGVEIQVDCFIKSNITHILMIQQKEKTSHMVHFSTIIPAHISPNAERKVYEISQNIAEAFELDNTPMHFQAFVDGDSVNIIEIAARVGGLTSCKVIKLVSGFDIIDYSIDILSGKNCDFCYHKPKQIYSILVIYARQSIFGKMIGLNELINQKIIEEFFILKTEGMIIPPGLSARSKVAALVIKAGSIEEISMKTNYVFQLLDVLDNNGNSVMIKDLKKLVWVK